MEESIHVPSKHSGYLLAALVFLSGCEKGPALSKEESAAPQLGEITEDSPLLGAIADEVPVFESLSKQSALLGSLHAGALVPRSEKFIENEECTEGWFQIAPRGYICSEKSATTDVEHPTLKAMALMARRDQHLPYVYARTTSTTALYKKSEQKGVELGGRIPKNTVMAIVGSWTAPDESHEPQRLGLRMDGRFVRADDLEAAAGSTFHGVEVSASNLPTAFVVRNHVYRYKIDSFAEKTTELEYHEHLRLTGERKTLSEEEFWEVEDGSWVRHRDVTTIRRRHEFPDFVQDGVRWLDISVITGTLTYYEGKTPMFSTLVSVGRDRLGEPETSASTPRGNFKIVEKHLTRRASRSEDALLDAPWALKLENDTWIYASPRHDRFGIEHTDGDVELSPNDGKLLFEKLGPEIPKGWNSLVLKDETLWVQIRK